MVSIIQGGDMGELMDDNTVRQIARKDNTPIQGHDGVYGENNVFYRMQTDENSLQLQSNDDGDTGGGSQAHSHSPHSMN